MTSRFIAALLSILALVLLGHAREGASAQASSPGQATALTFGKTSRTRTRDGAVVVMVTIFNAQNTVVYRTVGLRVPLSRVPFAGLTPGEYRVEVVLAPNGGLAPAVRRSIRFHVR